MTMENVKPIRNDEDLAWALSEVEVYFDNLPEPGTDECDRFDLLTDLIEAYEAKHHPLPDVDPIEFLDGWMSNNGLRRADLGAVIGQKSKATEVMQRIRPLSLAMILKIKAAWGVPVDALVKGYALHKRPARKMFYREPDTGQLSSSKRTRRRLKAA